MPISLVAASIAAAAIHFLLGPEHVEELGWLGAGFYLAGVLQLAWAGLAVGAFRGEGRAWTRVRRAILPAGIVINATILGAWLVSRIVGLPAGAHPWTPEAVGMSDAIAAILEASLVLGLARATRRPVPDLGPSPGPRTHGYPSVVGAAPILALILVATVVAVGAPHAHADDASHDASVMTLGHEPHTN